MGQKRLLSIDLIKVVAMCAVMCLHTQYAYSGTSPLAHFLYISSVVAIPLFFMTSGWLLLGRSDTNYKYAFRKIFGILRFVAIITVAWYAVSGYRHHTGLLNTTVGSLLQRGPMGVFWYFGAMIIIYALLPYLNDLYKKHFRSFICVILTSFIIASVVFILNISNEIHIEQHTIQTFRLWNWLFYFCIGGALKKCTIHVNWLLVAFMFAVNYLFQMQMLPYMSTQFCEYFYPSLPVMAFSIVLFVALRDMDGKNLAFVNGGGKIFLPCYAIHLFLIGSTQNYFEKIFPDSLGVNAMALCFWLFICIISISLSWLIMKIPFMDKFFRI